LVRFRVFPYAPRSIFPFLKFHKLDQYFLQKINSCAGFVWQIALLQGGDIFLETISFLQIRTEVQEVWSRKIESRNLYENAFTPESALLIVGD